MPNLAAFLACAGVALAADSTNYIGDANPYHVTAMTTDSNGAVYVTGSRAIVAVAGGNPLTDVFVSRLDASGNPTLIATFSGKGSEEARAIAIDPAGDVYIGGVTTSVDFPVHHALQPSGIARGSGFIVKLSAGGDILFSTYFGGTQGPSAVNGLAVDAQGNAYVTGTTQSPDFPVTAGLPAGPIVNSSLTPISGAFFAKISAAGDKVLYGGVLSSTTHACGAGSTCFLSPIATNGIAIAVDASGNAYVAGNTYGAALPTTAGALRADGIGAFVAKVNAAGTGMGYVTMLGNANFIPGGAFSNSNPGNLVYAIGADAQGNAYISGSTSDPNFPVTSGAYQTKFASILPPNLEIGPPPDAFIAKLNPTGTAMVWATYLGGSQFDSAQTLALDAKNNVWVSGMTTSNDFPSTAGVANGSEFLVELSADGSSLVQSTRLPGQSAAAALALDRAGVMHTAGSTGLVSTFTPGAPPAPRVFGIVNAAGGQLSGRVVAGEIISIYGLHMGPSTPVIVQPSNGFFPSSLDGVQATIGTSVPLLYLSDSQINAVVPVGLGPGATTLNLTVNGVPLSPLRLVIDNVAPQVFRNADGTAAAVNGDGTLNSFSSPVSPGSFVAIWASGTGSVPGSDGQVATEARFCCGVRAFSYPDATETTVYYSGVAPGLVTGAVQVNFQIPATARGSHLFYLTVSGKSSDPFVIYVTP